jgi:NitT/TauT family transport system permease protein
VQAAGHATRRTASSSPAVRGAAGVLGFLVTVEAVTRSRLVDPDYFPYASSVIGALLELLREGAFLAEVGWTLWAWLLAMVISVIVAVPLGIAIGSSAYVSRATLVPIELLRPLPAVALIPLAILVLGAGTTSKVLLALMATLWPILFNTIYGTHDVDPVAKDTARSFRIPGHARLLRVVLPSAAPFIMTGVRVSASLALIVLVGLELVAGTTNGIGSFILQASMAGDMSTVLAGATVAGVIGVFINAALAALERRFFGWRQLRSGGS